MECIEILGGKPLYGNVKIQGSKNAVLPIMAGTILNKGTSTLHNCPKIADVFYMIQILEHIGCKTSWSSNSLTIDAGEIHTCEIPQVYAMQMRSSVIMMGGLLGRLGKALLPYPGGCVIGERPIDIHLKSLRQLNVMIEESPHTLSARANEIIGDTITLSFPSVGATENVILASVYATGRTVLINSAKEPEIVELCNFLNKMGAHIYGAGTAQIIIDGVDRLSDVEYNIVPDRIVAGTYILAAVSSKGKITLEDAPVNHLEPLFSLLDKMNVQYDYNYGILSIDAAKARAGQLTVITAPYPGFPTDLQSQLMAAFCVLEGKSSIYESVFEARYKVAKELQLMGAHILLDDRMAIIEGVPYLEGASVSAQELRGGAALVIAALGAKGKTKIFNKHYIDRGYEDICRDLTALGATITCRDTSI